MRKKEQNDRNEFFITETVVSVKKKRFLKGLLQAIAVVGIISTCSVDEVYSLDWNNVNFSDLDIEKDSCGNIALYKTTADNVPPIVLQSGIGNNYVKQAAVKLHTRNAEMKSLALGGIDVVMAVGTKHLKYRFVAEYYETDWEEGMNNVITSLCNDATWNPDFAGLQRIVVGLTTYVKLVKNHVPVNGDMKKVGIGRSEHAETAVKVLDNLSALLANEDSEGRQKAVVFATDFLSALVRGGGIDNTKGAGRAEGTLDKLINKAVALSLGGDSNKEKAKNAMNWIRYALHTEVQAAALEKVGEIQIQNGETATGNKTLTIGHDKFYSLFSPCRSCMTLQWVKIRAAPDGANIFSFAHADGEAACALKADGEDQLRRYVLRYGTAGFEKFKLDVSAHNNSDGWVKWIGL
jgi:hypothetical protein